MKIALIHDWLTGMRGGESVLEAIAELFPKAELFTLIYVPEKISTQLTVLKRHTSWLQKIPFAKQRYRQFLPIMPHLIEKFDLTGFDLVISSSHCVAKGVRKTPGAVHVSYVHAPMRYMWDRYEDYFGPSRSSLPVRTAAQIVRKRLQTWDQSVSTSDRIDTILTNSHFIAGQIQRHYRRKAQVIYPFVNIERFSAPRTPSNNYLMVTAFAPYKRVDLAIEAFNQLQLPLLIVGAGQDEERLKKMAGSTVQFLGALSNASVTDLYSKCRALVFPGIEDFGITPLECMAAGAPVLALKEGGAVETVNTETGIFFHRQTKESLIEGIKEMEESWSTFSEKTCRDRAALFSKTQFQTQFTQAVRTSWANAGKDLKLL